MGTRACFWERGKLIKLRAILFIFGILGLVALATVAALASAPVDPFTSSPDGLDSSGLDQPGGATLFRMSTSVGHSVTKGVLFE